MMTHHAPYPLAGTTVRIKSTVLAHGGKDFEIRDWWDRCSGYGWMMGLSNPVCTSYAIRAGFSGRAEMFNNEVLYGKIGQFMHLFHVSELEDGEQLYADQAGQGDEQGGAAGTGGRDVAGGGQMRL